MEPEVQAILLRAHNNGGTVRLRFANEARGFIECFQRGYIYPVYDMTALPQVYLHHSLTPAGREALVACLK